jgi:hypothetical protein
MLFYLRLENCSKQNLANIEKHFAKILHSWTLSIKRGNLIFRVGKTLPRKKLSMTRMLVTVYASSMTFSSNNVKKEKQIKDINTCAPLEKQFAFKYEGNVHE